jgi:osmotically-inducible protein OsmY
MGKCQIAWLIPILVLAGCNRQDTDALGRIAKKVENRAVAVTSDLKTSAASSWSIAADPDLTSRVLARLHWDKQLADQSIEVVAAANGVELRGKVQSFEQHSRAMMLANSTTGVQEVKDSLVEGDN